jgi:cyanophycinase
VLASPGQNDRVSISLVGGGRTGAAREQVYGPFVAEALRHAAADGRQQARIGILVVHEIGDPEPGAEVFTRFSDIVADLGSADSRLILVAEGGQLGPGQLGDLDGLLVAGGLTPAYQHALVPVTAEIGTLVGGGVPYLGFSAGAAIAARRAIVGGWRSGALVICNEDNGEDLEELTVRAGLGLVELSVDVHAAQWGNVTRLWMAVETGAVESGVAIDEDTVLIVDGDRLTVAGLGQVWWVRSTANGTTMRVQAAKTPAQPDPGP